MAEKEVAAATPPQVPTVAPGIPAVEVDPSNELLDGENLERKADLIENEPVHVDESGRRLEHDDGDIIPPPASANLELRQRTEKTIAGMLGSIGKGEESPDSMVAALRAEHEGLKRRAADGDEKAGRRVSQVEKALAARGASVDPDESKADATPAEKRAAAAANDDQAKTAVRGRRPADTSKA